MTHTARNLEMALVRATKAAAIRAAPRVWRGERNLGWLADKLSNGLVRVYSTLATAYPAYIAVLLLPHVRKGLTSSQTSTRATSMFLLVGFTLAGIRFALGLVTPIAPPTYYVGQVISGGAAIFVALGLATAFFARSHRQRQVT